MKKLMLANPEGVISLSYQPASVVGLRRNNGEQWAYVMPTAAKAIQEFDDGLSPGARPVLILRVRSVQPQRALVFCL